MSIWAEEACFQLLNLSQQEQWKVLGQLDAADDSASTAGRISKPGERYRVSPGLMARFERPNETGSTHLVVPRKLCDTQICFLHAGYMHVNTRCTLRLRTLDGEFVLAEGRVAACRSVKGRTHEISVEFDNPIALDAFVKVRIVATPAAAAVADNAPVAGNAPTPDSNAHRAETTTTNPISGS